MPRAYTVATAALALGVEAKWLDNVLSHFTVPGVAQQRQGVPRKLGVEALVLLSTAILLSRTLGVPLGRTLDLSRKIIAADGRLRIEPTLELVVDLHTLRTETLERLEMAVEVAPVPRRGRPSKTTTGRLD